MKLLILFLLLLIFPTFSQANECTWTGKENGDFFFAYINLNQDTVEIKHKETPEGKDEIAELETRSNTQIDKSIYIILSAFQDRNVTRLQRVMSAHFIKKDDYKLIQQDITKYGYISFNNPELLLEATQEFFFPKLNNKSWTVHFLLKKKEDIKSWYIDQYNAHAISDVLFVKTLARGPFSYLNLEFLFTDFLEANCTIETPHGKIDFYIPLKNIQTNIVQNYKLEQQNKPSLTIHNIIIGCDNKPTLRTLILKGYDLDSKQHLSGWLLESYKED